MNYDYNIAVSGDTDMRIGRFLAATLLALAIPLMSGCFVLPSPYEVRASSAERRLDLAMQRLPIPPGTLLVEHVMATTGGTMPECEGRVIHALFGTDELSYREVLDFYTSTIPGEEWQADPRYSDDQDYRRFTIDNQYNLGISDAYNVSKVGPDAVREGKSRFRTIYLLSFSTPLEQPVADYCLW
jgi:hypothetical protein